MARPTSCAATTRSIRPVVVEDDHLGRPAVGEMGDGLCIVPVRSGGPVDDELTAELAAGEVLEPCRAECVAQPASGRDHGPATEGRRTRCRRLAGVELVVGIDDDADPVRRDAQLLAGDLAECRVDPLPHLGPGVEERDRAVDLRPQDRAGRVR